MHRCLTVVVCLLLGAWAAGRAAAEPPAGSEAPQIADFQLQDFVGRQWSLGEAEQPLVAVAFLGVECPLVQLYAGRLEQLQQQYADRGLLVVGVNANQQDSLAEMAAFARRHEITFPLLKDPGNRVADQFGAERTPEVFLLDAKRRVRYRGRVDDQYTYGQQRPEPTRHFLREAVDDLLASRPVKRPRTETIGCHIGRLLQPQDDAAVTYSNQIARLFQRRCVECHREGEIAPFSLTSYDESVGWAEMILEVALERRMPPWHASPEHGEFHNDARLSDGELDLLRKWVAAGAPEGDPQQLPAPRTFHKGWRIGEPDLVIPMSDKPFHVPARGEVKYQYFVADPGFTEDKWVQAAECRPGNRAVVHHILVGLRGGPDSKVHGRRSQWLAATAPGAIPLQLPPGCAKKIPAGAKLLFQMHYTPNGVAQDDLSSIGLKFADPDTVKHVVATHQAANPDIEIPARARNHQEQADYEFRQDGVLLSMFPHMHLRGKAFQYKAYYPNGDEEILLDVPQYDFNWQNAYLLKEPKRMPAGTRLVCTAHYDNSEENLANPAPDEAVGWGDQTWEEMMIGYFDLYDAAALNRTRQFLRQADEVDAEALEAGAAGGLSDDESFQRLGAAVRGAMPQVDRADLVVVGQRQMRVERVFQSAAVLRQLGAKVTVGVDGMALPELAGGRQHVVHGDLSQAAGADIRYMRRAMASAAHFPLEHDGRPAVLSFWSSEPDAFPEAAVKLLHREAAAAQR